MRAGDLLVEARMSAVEAHPEDAARHIMNLYFKDPQNKDFGGLSYVMNTLAQGSPAEKAVANAIFGAQLSGNFAKGYDEVAAAYRSGKV